MSRTKWPEVSRLKIEGEMSDKDVEDAFEIVCGRAHVVIVAGKEGTIGISSIVRPKTATRAQATAHTLDLAVGRLEHMRAKRAANDKGEAS
jgi:hypothetical protein